MRLKLSRPNPALTAIVLEGLFSRLSFGLITFALPLYARHLGLSLTKIGLLASLNTAVALALKPLMGWVADRIGTKRAFMFAIGIRSAISLALGFAALPWQLFAIRSAHGLSMSLRDPSANALIAENGGKKSVASAFAWYQTSKSLAGSLSKAAAGVLGGRKTSAYPALALDIRAGGAEWVDGDAVVDGNVVSGRAWPDHPAWMRAFMAILKEHAQP